MPAHRLLTAAGLLAFAAFAAQAQVDLKTIQLPRSYAGDSPEAVVEALSKSIFSKDPFENDATYAQRVKALGPTLVFEQRTLAGPFVFKPPEGSVRFSYDANREVWKFTLGLLPVGNSYGTQGIKVFERSAKAYEYPAIAAIYASRGKLVTQTNVIYLQMDKAKAQAAISGQFKSKPLEAKGLDGWLAIAVFGHVLPPYTSEGTKYANGPDDHVVEHFKSIRFVQDGVWVFDKRTGEVYSKTWEFKRN